MDYAENTSGLNVCSENPRSANAPDAKAQSVLAGHMRAADLKAGVETIRDQ